jgi:cysteine desulfurase
MTVTYLSPDRAGLITPAQVAAALTPQTILVSVMAANNEVGTVQPIPEIGQVCRAHRVPFHTDAVQAVGEMELQVSRLSVDALTLSAHKCYGPKGVGALYVRSGIRLQPQQQGGGQEHDRRAGTHNVAGIVGMAAALQLAQEAPDTRVRQAFLRERLLAGLLTLPHSRLHGSRTQRVSNNVNVGFAGVIGETLLLTLDLAGIAVSTGAACAAGAVAPSHVLRAMGYSAGEAQEAIRFTLGRETTAAEIDQTIAIVRETVTRLRARQLRLPPPALPEEGCPS